jgi:aspartyl aminopeptidase
MSASINGGAAESEKKTEGQLLSERLVFEQKNGWDATDSATEAKIAEFAEAYKRMLDIGKTEREFCAASAKLLRDEGYRDLDELMDSAASGGRGPGGVLKPGDKVYQVIRGKTILAAIIGRRPVAEGANILGAHIDSPRIDLKTNPLYEDTEFAMIDTQYYGGIKKYQWVTIPLALHGVVIKENGERADVCIGEDDADPVFTITDLLPHLAREQMEKKASEAVTGEGLNVLAGSVPYKDGKATNKVKLNLLRLLNERYGIVEQDFAGAELEMTPASRARDVGLDRSMIGAYGHDDRSCAFAALRALADMGRASISADAGDGASPALPAAGAGSLAGNAAGGANHAGDAADGANHAGDAGSAASGHGADGAPAADAGAWAPERTCVCALTDKEEIGSMGNTGAESKLFENFMAYLCCLNSPGYSDITLRQSLTRSFMLSADVNPAVDPNYEGVQDKKTASYFGRGIVLTKYTGHRGKGGGSDANAEFCNKVRAIMNKNGVAWQYGDLGKVDQGGGGTIAQYVANLGVEVLDCGIPVLSMHAPFEVISKLDLYTTYKGYLAFLKDA